MTGRPPKPTEQKRRTGNPGGRPLPAPVVMLPAVAGPPDPPRPLAEPGTALWHRIWASASWISDRSDLELVLMVCEQTDERAALRFKVLREANWRDRAALRSLEDQLARNLSILGLSPTDRARLGLAEVAAKSTLERLRSAQQNRAES